MKFHAFLKEEMNLIDTLSSECFTGCENSNTLRNNHFIIKYKVHGMVARRSRRLVRDIPRHYFFNVTFYTFYTLVHFWLVTQKLMPP